MPKTAVFYIYDALCGWCYGFSPVMKAFFERHRGDTSFFVLSGGMVLGEKAGPIGQVAGYIKDAYKTVEQRTGVVFGEGFLTDILEPGVAHFSSEKPALAMTVFRRHKADEAINFAHRLQQAVYHDGIWVDDWQSYPALAAEFGLDGESFLQEMQQDQVKRQTYEEFELVGQMGVKGFPTVLLQTEKHRIIIGHGYLTELELEANFQQALQLAAQHS